MFKFHFVLLKDDITKIYKFQIYFFNKNICSITFVWFPYQAREYYKNLKGNNI